MAMLSSCTTLLSRAPAPAPGKSSPATALHFLRSRQPAAASVADLRWAHARSTTSRAMHRLDFMHSCEKNDGDWRLTEKEDQITLMFLVGGTSKDELEVATTEDQTLLVISYKKEEDKSSRSSPAASSLNVRLRMPPGYDSNKMQATMLPNGWLQIVITKPKHEPKTISMLPAESFSDPPTPPAAQ